MTLHGLQRPRIITCIHDAVVAMDVEAAFGEAGFDVLNIRAGATSGDLPSAFRNCSYVLLDQDIGWQDLVALAQPAQEQGIPVGLFIVDDKDDALPPELSGAKCWQKPFDTGTLVNEVQGTWPGQPVLQGA